MLASFLNKDFSKKVKAVGAVADGALRELMANVLLTCNDDNTATLTASNGSTTLIQARLGCKVDVPGEVLLPPAFVSWISKAKRGERLTIKINNDVMIAEVGRGKAEFSLLTEPYPSLHLYDPPNHTVKADMLGQALKAVLASAGDEAYEYIHFTGKVIAATDNLRLTYATIEGLGVEDICIRPDSAKHVLSILDTKEIQMGQNGGLLCVKSADYSLQIVYETLEDTGAPPIGYLVPKPDAPIPCPPDLLSVLEEAGALDSIVVLTFDGQSLHVKSGDARAKFTETLAITDRGLQGEVILNTAHAIQACRFAGKKLALVSINTIPVLGFLDACEVYLVPLARV